MATRSTSRTTEPDTAAEVAATVDEPNRCPHCTSVAPLEGTCDACGRDVTAKAGSKGTDVVEGQSPNSTRVQDDTVVGPRVLVTPAEHRAVEDDSVPAVPTIPSGKVAQGELKVDEDGRQTTTT